MTSPSKSDLRPFFEPRSVAVLGSLKKEGEAYTVIENLLRFGFTGRIYPVNPSYSEVLGLRAYPTVNDVNDPIDLAMMITPPSTVPLLVEQCAHQGIKAVIVGTEGFAEVGETGARLQQQLVDLAHRHGVRLLGPNTIGIVNTSNGLITNPYFVSYGRIIKGNIAYASQSGFVGAQGQPLEDRAYPISKMCDFGNKCDVDEADLLDYLLEDSETKAVSLHLEAVKNGRRFMAALRRVAAHQTGTDFQGRPYRPGCPGLSFAHRLAGRERIGL
jgi:acetyltransferase